jgi:AAA domain
LCENVAHTLIAESGEELARDPGRIPVVMVEATLVDGRPFNWGVYYRDVLEAFNEPLIDQKIDYELQWSLAGPRAPRRRTPGAMERVSELSNAVKQALFHRRPAALLIDEGQHIAHVGGGVHLKAQLECLKSMANRTRVVHVLVGTYELQPFRDLSAQLSRRSIDLHFARYNAKVKTDEAAFHAVVAALEELLPLETQPDLLAHWEYLFEGSIGNVGVLKDWLLRALRVALQNHAQTMALAHLEGTVLQVAQLRKMLEDATRGEAAWKRRREGRAKLREMLALTPLAEESGSNGRSESPPLVSETKTGAVSKPEASPKHAPKRGSPRPGRRKATRDPYGGTHDGA